MMNIANGFKLHPVCFCNSKCFAWMKQVVKRFKLKGERQMESVFRLASEEEFS